MKRTAPPVAPSRHAKLDVWPSSEAELCAAAVAHFRKTVDVHQEVMPRLHEISPVELDAGVGPIDIVLVKPGGDLIAIEAKLRFKDEVITQALARRRYAHFIAVLTPVPPANTTKAQRSAAMFLSVCRDQGIGVYWARMGQDGKVGIICEVEPTRNDSAKVDQLEDGLSTATRRFNVAGTKNGNESNGGFHRFGGGDVRWRMVREYLERERLTGGPGGTGYWGEVKTLARDLNLRRVDHNDLIKALRKGQVGGVESSEQGGRLMIRLRSAAPESSASPGGQDIYTPKGRST